MKSILVIFLCALNVTLGNEVTFTAKVNKQKVAANETFQVTFEVNQRGNNFQPPSNLFNDFKLFQGPKTMQSMRLVNNTMTQSYSYSYILLPNKEGTFTIEPASITIDGKTYKSNKVKISVGKSTQPNQGKNNKNNQANSINDKIFLTIEPSRTKVYQGEQIFLKFKLYNKTNLVNIKEEIIPDMAGFIVSDIEMKQGAEYSREQVNGKTYEVYTIKKGIIIPQRSGKLEIAPLELDAVVQVKEGMIQTWFGPRPNMVNKKVHLKSNKVIIESLPLPSPKPESFSGAVGDFTFNASIDKTELEADEAITLNVKVIGTGDISLIEPQLPDFEDSFEVYDPKISTKTSNKKGVLTGSKTWEYLIIPRVGGEFELKPVVFTSFNPKTKNYITKKSEINTITVKGNAESISTSGLPITNRTAVISGTDIRFIHLNNLALKETGLHFFRSTFYWLLIGLLLFITLVVTTVVQKQKALQADTVKFKQKKAGKMASKYLKNAASHIENNNLTQFYEAAEKGMLTYFGDKLNIPSASLNIQNITNQLQKKNVSESHILELEDLINSLQMARYAPSTAQEPEAILRNAEKLIKQLEEDIK